MHRKKEEYVVCDDGTVWAPRGSHPGNFASVHNPDGSHKRFSYHHDTTPSSGHPGKITPDHHSRLNTRSIHQSTAGTVPSAQRQFRHREGQGYSPGHRGDTISHRHYASRTPLQSSSKSHTSSGTRSVPKRTTSVIQSSTMITKTSQKRKTHDELLKNYPGILCIHNAFPTERALSVMEKILKYHDPNPTGGKPHLSDRIMFAWLPNASWVGETLSGYVFSVDGSEKSTPYGDSTSGGQASYSTPVVSDMFPREKMLYGMLCIRLPNTKKNSLSLNPIDSLELYSEKDMDDMLRDSIKDDDDLSGEGSYAGFYISEDSTREWERTVWIVVSTGDRDISHTIHEYLKGDYNPYAMRNNKKTMKDISDEMKSILKRVKDAAIKSNDGASIDPTKHDEEDTFCGEDEFVDDMLFSQKSKEKSRKKRHSRRKKARAHSEKRSLARSSTGGGSRGKNIHKGTDTLSDDQKSTIERLLEVQLPEEERCAWKYSKLIKEVHRLIRAHATNAASEYGDSPDIILGDYEGEPECVRHRAMTWEGNLMKESFIDGMMLRMKEKRWLVASKLASVLGFDLNRDFDINPLDKNIDNHRNVVHVTTNMFVQNKRAAKMVYYSGAYCKHEMEGALPVPVSPLEGVHILKGPPLGGLPTAEDSRSKDSVCKPLSSVHCISGKRFQIVSSSSSAKRFDGVSSQGGDNISIECEDELGRRGGRSLARSTTGRTNPLHRASVNSRKASFMGSSEEDEETSSSYDSSSEEEEEDSYVRGQQREERRRDAITELVGGEELRVFKLRSYADVDKDKDLGGQWLLNKEHPKSIDCKGAFPFGTGRAMSYLRIPPCTLSGNKSEKGKQYEKKMHRIISVGKVPGHIIPTSEWGPRGVWVIGGSDGIRSRQGRRILFTWNDTDYPTHPRLARGMFRDRVEGFQTRETDMGWSPTFGSLVLQPRSVILHSPVNPLT